MGWGIFPKIGIIVINLVLSPLVQPPFGWSCENAILCSRLPFWGKSRGGSERDDGQENRSRHFQRHTHCSHCNHINHRSHYHNCHYLHHCQESRFISFHPTHHHFHFHRARGNKTIFLLAAVVLIFILSWLPLNLLNVLLDLDLYSSVKRGFQTLPSLLKMFKHLDLCNGEPSSGQRSLLQDHILWVEKRKWNGNTLFNLLTPSFTL